MSTENPAPTSTEPTASATVPPPKKVRPLKEEVTGEFEVPVFNQQGLPTGTIKVDASEFGGKINRQLMHEVVLMFRANQRSGTHSTKRRGEVAGSTKKLFRQKGTGNARAGTKRTNKRRGGGTAKGPKPRDYEYHLPRKAVQAATRMALLSKIRDGEAVVVEDLNITTPKTKEMAALIKAMNLKGFTLLIGTAAYDEGVYKSARNIDGVEILPAAQFNTYAILRPKKLVLTRSALEALRKPRTTEAGATTETSPTTEQKG